MIILILSDKSEINSFQHLFSIFSNIRTILYDRHFSVGDIPGFNLTILLNSYTQEFTRV